MKLLLGDFFAQSAEIVENDGILKITLPDGRWVAFAIVGMKMGNPNAVPMKDSPLLKDFLAKRAGKPDDDPEAA